MKIWIVTVLIVFGSVISVSSTEPEKKLNTAENANYLTPLEKEVVYEINLFRSNPAKYAEEFIAPLAKYYEGRILHYPGDIAIKTNEGVGALYECVRELKKARSLDILQPSEALSLAAGDHQKDQENTGNTGHSGSDRSDLKIRIERYGSWQDRIAENIAYGNTSARQIVIFLLIDDGVKNRGHRTNLLHPAFKNVGIACGKHPVYRTMCVMDFAGGIIKK
ncbi:CAP domain-containing protein [uncultured Draconibacterium sp.]|uniref:CAP domain-containing protein n=1 Tax=uncultured Draconibacterium sp. TaxID=1573823 RepID=UPI003216E1BA